MENETNPVTTEGADLHTQVAWLRKQIFTILVLTIVISGTLNVYLWRLGRQRHGELVVLRAQVLPVLTQYNQMAAPRMDEFVRRIVDYGKTHPDFAPIMMKYNLTPPGASATPPPPSTPPPPGTPASK